MTIKRRDFIKISGILGAGLLLEFQLSCTPDKDEPLITYPINAFLKIGSDNSIEILAKNPEIGQGVKTSLPMIIAEELDVDWSQVKVVQAGYNGELGGQGAGGSMSIKSNWEPLRKVGATARYMVMMAAAERWGVEMDDLTTESGKVYHKQSKRSADYGELAEAAGQLEAPEEVPLKDPADFKIIGTAKTTVDINEIVKGQATFGIDARPDDAYVAVVARCPVFGGQLKSFDASACKSINGFIDAIEIPAADNPTLRRSGVAVIAKDTWTAMKARKALQTEWETPADLSQSHEGLLEEMRRKTSRRGEIRLKDEGEVDRDLQQAAQSLEATYSVPFLAHSAMEPHNYTASVVDGKAECWGPTQLPGPVGGVLIERLAGISKENATVYQQRNGGGFGRRLLVDNVAEALYVSKELNHPVQVLWTREDDFSHDYYRPMGMYHLKGALDGQGQLTSWYMNAATTSRYMYRNDDQSPHRTEVFPDAFPAGFVPNFRVEYSPISTHVPTGAWRAPGHNAVCFAEHCFLDELAEAAAKDPIEFSLQLLGTEDKEMPYDDHGGPTYSTGRLRAVITKVRELSSWDDRAEKNRILGFAAQFMFGAYVAEVVELETKPGVNDFKISKVFAVVDCGIVVNQSGGRAQVEGAITDGINAALYGEVRIAEGQAQDRNYDTYRMLRMSECPDIEVEFIISKAAPQGLGEIALPPVSSALANAIYQLTGERQRSLPLKKRAGMDS